MKPWVILWIGLWMAATSMPVSAQEETKHMPIAVQDEARRSEVERAERTGSYVSTRDELQQSLNLKSDGHNSHVDLYGDTTAMASTILNRFSHEVYRLAMERNHIEQKYHPVPAVLLKKMKSQKAHLCEKIKRYGHYLYVNYQMVTYPPENQHYVTIEVIRQEAAYRMDFIKAESDVAHVRKEDAIQTMLDYMEAGIRLASHHQLDLKTLSCTSYHCLFGFSHPELKPYRQKFDEAVLHQKPLIVETLKQDKDMQRRVASVYLIGEFHSKEEIMKLLNPYVDDKDYHVRNSVMRVIGDTMRHGQITDIDLKPFIHLLDSPYETDRNKALFILFIAMGNPEQKKVIHALAYEQLIDLAKLKQPNLHEIAVRILEQL